MPSSRRLPPIVSIEAFEAAARLGGFANAARELGTSAASVSYHVKQLEARSGLVLFQRSAQRVDLTVAGAALATEVSAAFESLRGSFAGATKRDEQSLSISALPTFGASWLIPRLGKFSGPHVDLDLSVEPQDLLDSCEVAIRNGDGNWHGVNATRLFSAVFLPLCAPTIRPKIGSFLETGIPLLGRRDWWKFWFAEKGCELSVEDRFGAEFAAEHLDITAAIAGQGIAIGSPIIFADEIEAGRLTYADDLIATDGRAFWVCSATSRAKVPKIERFRNWIIGEAAQTVAAVCERLPALINSASHRAARP